MFVWFTKNNAISVSLLKEMLGVKKWAVSCLKGNVITIFLKEKKPKKQKRNCCLNSIFEHFLC